MKSRNSLKVITLVSVMLALMFTISCKKDSNNQGNGGNNRIVIKGKIPTPGTGKSNSLKSTGELSLADAKKSIGFQ